MSDYRSYVWVMPAPATLDGPGADCLSLTTVAALMCKSAPEFGKPRGLASANSRLAEYGVAVAELRFADSTM